MDALDAAQRIVAEHFPEASVAFLGGSVLTSQRTATSDLDIVVVLPGSPAPYRETIVAHGWPVELFVHTRASLDDWWAKDAQRRRCTLAHLCAEGTVLRDALGEAAEIQSSARALVDAGPPPIATTEVQRRRYLVTDLLEDFLGSDNEVETAFIVAALIVEASELALVARGRWLAGGKWLVRNLESSPGTADQLVRGESRYFSSGDKEPLTIAVRAVLALVGGPLSEGHRVAGDDDQKDTRLLDAWLVAARRGEIGLADDEVRLLEPRPAWPLLFESLRATLAAELPGARITHIGSTSVPGLVAKPLIDVSIGLESNASLDADLVDALGLEFRAVNPESTLFALYAPDRRRLANIHVRMRDSTHERWDLLFRDYLRAHPEAAAAYDEAKHRAAASHTDRARYSEAKGSFVASLMPEAERWAVEVEWRAPD